MNEPLYTQSRYQNTVVKVTFPWLNSTATGEYITKMTHGAEVKDITPKPRRGATQSRVLEFTFNQYREWAVNSFIKEIGKVFNPAFLSVVVTKVNAFNNDWELYEDKLSTHDWYYAFSDDHGVWSAGEASSRVLAYLRENLGNEDKQRAEALWEKYVKN